jgi:signal transduction histidine kinase
MAALGMLVAGIAHEINTPVGAINSMHDTLVRAIEKLKGTMKECDLSAADSTQMKPTLSVIDDANRVIKSGTERVTTIVRRLRSFARLDEAELKEVDIHEGIEDTLTLIHHEIKNRIELVRNFGDIPRVTCFPGRLNQVFLNLLNNARQAIEGEGKITITTAAVNKKIEIRFADTGRGIAPDTVSRVFDPGFTTKGVGVGTGLGLSICYQIIEDHHGHIDVKSRLGKGTTFTIVLPTNLDELMENGE